MNEEKIINEANYFINGGIDIYELIEVERAEECIENLLNLIEKQQKEIEELKVKEYVINSQLANTYWKEKIKEIHKNTDNKFDFTEQILKLIGE